MDFTREEEFGSHVIQSARAWVLALVRLSGSIGRTVEGMMVLHGPLNLLSGWDVFTLPVTDHYGSGSEAVA